MFSRIFLFLLANFGVLAVLSVSMRVLGVDECHADKTVEYASASGGSYQCVEEYRLIALTTAN